MFCREFGVPLNRRQSNVGILIGFQNAESLLTLINSLMVLDNYLVELNEY